MSLSKYRAFLENPAVTNVNRLPARATIVPSDKAGVYYKNKEDSPFLQSLNGIYDFLYCEEDSDSEFYKSDLDTSNWDTIDVPSMWQYRGYGKVQYPNIDYPIPINPPFIDCENPVGYYRKSFISYRSERVILHFGGVDSAFAVYLNEEFVGFSKGSRNFSEFDVTDIIRDGENLLAVKVYTYCDGTYLENQDMLTASGIFRDVYLLHTGSVSLWDYRVNSDLHGFDIAIKLSKASSDCRVRVCIDGEEKEFSASEEIKARFDIKNPRLWNAEEPNLYRLTITLLKDGTVLEVHSKKIGMMHSRCEGPHLLVNGSPVYIKGINRHEYDCKNGRAISVSLIEKELRLIKENNINAIRCSHYTNNPAFYEICSELGIYVMDEADVESHGGSATGDQGFISKRPEWLPSYMDRTVRMLEQNKNETCIFMHSMANEAGWGQNLIECLKYSLAFDPDHVSIHDMEEATGRDEIFKTPEYDFFKREGYHPRAKILEKLEKYPRFMQIEYGHAMGNSPGFLEGYQRMVYENESFAGGFVWEFKNHGFYTVDESGNEYYRYGGDFGDINHWTNFCLDGYIMSDGTPKPSWYELGEVFSPVWVEQKDGKIILRNTYDFRNLNTISVKWEMSEDYKVISSGEAILPKCSPHNETELTIPTELSDTVSGAKYFLTLRFYDGDKKIGTRQLEITSEGKKEYICKSASALSIDGNTVIGDGFSVSFKDGVISSYAKDGKEIISDKMQLNIFRAPTDNDGIETMSDWCKRQAGEWRDTLLQHASYRCRESSIFADGNKVICTSYGKLTPTGKWLGFDIEAEFTIYPDGNVLVSIKGTPYGKIPSMLPRIGVYFKAGGGYENLTWYGRGERENYCDSKLAAPIGLYSKRVSESYNLYDVPQECGNHEDTAFVSLADSERNGISVIGSDSFAFSCHDFPLASLEKARHRNELCRTEEKYLYIDYKMRGLGSHSCGPRPEEEFELHPHSFVFSFVIAANKTVDECLELSRLDFGKRSGEISKFVSEAKETERTLL